MQELPKDMPAAHTTPAAQTAPAAPHLAGKQSEKIQVDKAHYDFKRYSHVGRWASYYYQLKAIMSLGLGSGSGLGSQSPVQVLEIGVGDRVFGSFLKNNTAIAYTSVDFDPALGPDIVASVLSLPVADNSFDVVCAFEVLEHLPFDDFEKALLELKRVSKKHVVVSLPHFGPAVQLFFKIPFLRAFYAAFKIPAPYTHVFNGEHYWEIGKKGYSVARIKAILQKHFTLCDDFVPFENQYHHFFILQK